MTADWRNLPVPPRLRSRPKDARGYPITFVTQVIDGVPDFTVIDGQRLADCARFGRCAVCGHPLGRFKCFVGGPLSCEAGQFSDGPMHRECAAYAMLTCPHIASPNARYRKDRGSDAAGLVTSDLIDPNRPERFGLYVTTGYRTVLADRQMLIFIADPPSEPVTWSHDVSAPPSVVLD